jgi:hypothetical protein
VQTLFRQKGWRCFSSFRYISSHLLRYSVGRHMTGNASGIIPVGVFGYAHIKPFVSCSAIFGSSESSKCGMPGRTCLRRSMRDVVLWLQKNHVSSSGHFYRSAREEDVCAISVRNRGRKRRCSLICFAEVCYIVLYSFDLLPGSKCDLSRYSYAESEPVPKDQRRPF